MGSRKVPGKAPALFDLTTLDEGEKAPGAGETRGPAAVSATAAAAAAAVAAAVPAAVPAAAAAMAVVAKD